MMEEREKQQREHSKRCQEANKKLPERQLQMFLTAERYRCSSCKGLLWYCACCTNRLCQAQTNRSIEPGMTRLKEEYSTGRIIILDEQTHNRLVEFAKPDDTYQDLLNRLLDIASASVVEQQKKATAAAAEMKNK